MYEGLANLLRMQGMGLTRDPRDNMLKKYSISDLIPVMAQQAFGSKQQMMPTRPAPMPPQMSQPAYRYKGGPMVDGDDYVIDAYTVAALGNGSSEAGAKVLDESLPKTGNQDGSYTGMVESNTGDGMSDDVAFEVENGGEIDGARISRDEYIVDKEQVAAAGGGDVSQGVKNLDKMREEIREQAYGQRQQPKQIEASRLIDDIFKSA